MMYLYIVQTLPLVLSYNRIISPKKYMNMDINDIRFFADLIFFSIFIIPCIIENFVEFTQFYLEMTHISQCKIV